MNEPRVLGNDDPCPCGSGKTLAACCLRGKRAAYENGIPVIQMPAPPSDFTEMLRQERQRQATVGQIRPAVHAGWQRQKLIAVGNKILHSARWKTPGDFLSSYLKHVMTAEWCKGELAKPLTSRHPVMQWYDAMRRLQLEATLHAGAEALFGVVPSGAMRAYMLLAFDLYSLQHHQALQDRLVHRLRNCDQYQGARHELFAAATCIRAGFDIEHDDESDRSRRHTEFTAVHRLSNSLICVEAKSKHRPGILGMAGERQPVDKIRTRLGGLINDAIGKPYSHPLVIFLDLNLPPTSPPPASPEWFKTFAEPILRGLDRNGKEDPWSLIVFSNYPDHYATDDGPSPGGYALGMLGRNTRNGPQPPFELMEIIAAAKAFGTLPNRFEEM